MRELGTGVEWATERCRRRWVDGHERSIRRRWGRKLGCVELSERHGKWWRATDWGLSRRRLGAAVTHGSRYRFGDARRVPRLRRRSRLRGPRGLHGLPMG